MGLAPTVTMFMLPFLWGDSLPPFAEAANILESHSRFRSPSWQTIFSTIDFDDIQICEL